MWREAPRDGAGSAAAEPDRGPAVRLRAANRTILTVSAVATVVQSAGAVGRPLAQVVIAGLGVVLAVFAVWLQLPKRPWRPSTVLQLSATLRLAVVCYAVVFVAGVVTAGADTYRYSAGVRPEERITFTGTRGSATRTSEWTLDASARVDTVLRRSRHSTRDPTSLSGGISVGSSCGRVEWTLSADDRPLSHGTLDGAAGPRPLDVPLPAGPGADTVRLTLARVDPQSCTATVTSSRLRAVGRPSIPLPGLERYLRRS
jgi:hypothetical protein